MFDGLSDVVSANRQIDIRNFNDFITFLKEIIDCKIIINIPITNQFTMRLPVDLQNNELFIKLYEYIKPQKPKYRMILDGVCYYWGFKSNNIELIRQDHYYDDYSVNQKIHEIFKSIAYTIWERETPVDWKTSQIQYQNEKHQESIEIINKLK